MAKQRRREGKHSGRWHFAVDERVGQAPHMVTAGVVAAALAGYALPAAICSRPCAQPFGHVALLPASFDIDTVPTRVNYVPIIQLPAASGGTVFR